MPLKDRYTKEEVKELLKQQKEICAKRLCCMPTAMLRIQRKKTKEVDRVYLANPNDFIYDGDTIVRMKRKYGRFSRNVFRIEF